jgi:hypothetical protein
MFAVADGRAAYQLKSIYLTCCTVQFATLSHDLRESLFDVIERRTCLGFSTVSVHLCNVYLCSLTVMSYDSDDGSTLRKSKTIFAVGYSSATIPVLLHLPRATAD